MITVFTKLPNGDVPKITVGLPQGSAMIRIPLVAQLVWASGILDQLRDPESEVFWLYTPEQYAALVGPEGQELRFL